MRQPNCRYTYAVILSLCLPSGLGYQPSTYRSAHTDKHQPRRLLSRREWVAATIAATATTTTAMSLPTPAFAAAAGSTNTRESTSNQIRLAGKALQALLDSWEDEVIDCNYADVPRELLEQKNKEELLEKASTFALFDKSVSVVTCKTSNKKIRDYLGRTGIGPVVGLDKKLRQGLEFIEDPGDLEPYVQATEAIQQALSRADSYSYSAGGDYSALNNFGKEETAKMIEVNGNLQQVQTSIRFALDNLSVVLGILDK